MSDGRRFTLNHLMAPFQFSALNFGFGREGGGDKGEGVKPGTTDSGSRRGSATACWALPQPQPLSPTELCSLREMVCQVSASGTPPVTNTFLGGLYCGRP